ncbi:RIP metalloprotease RseP [Alistipes sp. D31t1_170403_E11]|uniref:RIP metalloprotease RseP n=1 Tax=Alistipes sp. D31t1_170403_E11 TaxID=2787128 RepID=UPI00189AED89|nr:RIP metalloprotease RseP [Alistipes sp. D31t1_170403_E11]
MDILVKIIQFFLCFTILIGIHELGHFVMARVFKIRVEKFYIFFDLGFSLFKFRRGDTEYGLGWLPLGGYCKIAGMIDESMDTEQMKQPAKPDEFRTKPAWQRFLVMIAGVVMNVVLAVTIYIGICYTWGDTYFSNADAKWGYNFNEAGHKLGFHDGDRFVSIDGEEVDDINKIVNALIITEGDRSVVVERNGQQVELTLPLDELISMRQQKGYEDLIALRRPFTVDSVMFESAAALHVGDEIVGINDVEGLDFPAYQKYLKAYAGDSVLLKVLRGGDVLELSVPLSEGRIGVMTQYPFEVRTQKYTFWESIPAGIHRTGKVISSYWDQLKMIVQPKTKMYEELGGFIAIGSIFPSTWDWQDFWMKTAFLSIILAVMNILPIPGLDGGHAIFTFWEMITGRKVSDKVLEAAQYVGLIIILMLLLYANGNDIYRFFIK